MVFSCAVAPPADAKCCAAAAHAADAASGCSRGAQALRAGCRAPPEAKTRLRESAAARFAAQLERLYLLCRHTRERRGAARVARVAETRRARRGAQSHQALHPRSVSPHARGARRARCAGAAALWRSALFKNGGAVARHPPTAEAMMVSVLRFALHAYRWCLRPLLPPSCRFFPSCSEFAEEALARHGLWRGGWLAARRLCRCGPWHPGGHDPVP